MLIKSILSHNLIGEVVAPPDKSISHRAIILASLASGISYIQNLLCSEDIEVTLNWAKYIGVNFKQSGNSLEIISDIDIKTKKYNNRVYKFYLGNSGTSARLLMGVMAGFGGTSLFYGDASLSKRPMLRVISPLALMNAEILAIDNCNDDLKLSLEYLNKINSLSLVNTNLAIDNLKLVNSASMHNALLPLIVKSKPLKGIKYTLNIASAQIKSAILLAGLFTEDETTVIELNPSRDHTENMLKTSGIDLNIEINNNGVKVITLLQGKKNLKTNNWKIPGDFSSAAFIIVAALIVPESHIFIQDVNLNPLRTGLLKVLIDMGADINIKEKQEVCGEKFGDLEVKYTKNLKPVVINKNLVPLMIDEFPILSCLVSLINGESKFFGIEELRYKESDRIAAIENNLNNLGIKTWSSNDSLIIYGNHSIINHPKIKITPKLDHRIAMSFLVLGLAMINGIMVEDAEVINTSFPQFIDIMRFLGAKINLVN